MTAPAPTWTKLGDQANGYFWWSVASAGDVDRNGYFDLLVGSPDYDSNGYVDNGKAELFYANSSGINTSSAWSLAISQGFAHTGYAVSPIGDFNGDTYPDFAVGIPDYTYGAYGDGAVYTYKGGSSGVTALNTIVGSTASRFGFSIAFIGDIDLNGYDDFAVGSPEYNPGGGAKGAVTVFKSTGSIYSTQLRVGENLGDKFGFSVAGVGDLDGDGYPELLEWQRDNCAVHR